MFLELSPIPWIVTLLLRFLPSPLSTSRYKRRLVSLFGDAEGRERSGPEVCKFPACSLKSRRQLTLGYSDMAPNKKTAASRAAASKGKTRVPSASKGGLGVGPAAGKRKRSVDSHSNSSDRDSDGGEPLPRTTIKKCKVSPGNASESMDSAHALGDSSSANADGPMGLDPPANHAIGERRKHKKSGIMAIDTSLKPISDVREMFEDMVFRIDPIALKESPIKLNVATLCSGTDAPIFALELIQDALQAMGYGEGFEFNHLFSCEIEPYKQGFIRRNLPHDTTIFRDVVELASAVSTGQA